LNKPGRLNEKELIIMRTHPLRGYEILKKQKNIPDAVLFAALDHHEKFDGSGYPRGLKGEAISDFSRLLSVVDVYDALTSKRVYKDPLPPGKVLGMMFKWRVTDYHPNIVEEFIKSLGVYPVGSFVRLSNGNHAVVIDHNIVDPLLPLVREVYDGSMRQIPATEIDLAVGGTTITEVVNPEDYNINVYRLI
jgi:HD-GYP domain-containing protein (c-di-GMP phosphodiesterase class II)